MSGWANLHLRQVYKTALEGAYEKRKHKLLDQGIKSVNGYINDVILRQSAYEEIRQFFAIATEYKGDENNVTVKDKTTGELYEVRFVVMGEERVTPLCEQDNSGVCIHSFYVHEHPGLKKALTAKGLRWTHWPDSDV